MNEVQAELEELDKVARSILDPLIGASTPVEEETITHLNKIAMSAAKLAYGNGHPEYLSDRLENLITWCDHLNEEWWKENFKVALVSGPLVSPWPRNR